MNGVVIFAILSALGAGPLVAVHLGGKAFDEDGPKKPQACTDDTVQIPRVRAKIRPDAY